MLTWGMCLRCELLMPFLFNYFLFFVENVSNYGSLKRHGRLKATCIGWCIGSPSMSPVLFFYLEMRMRLKVNILMKQIVD